MFAKKKSIGFLSIIIFGVISIGFLNLGFISTSAQTLGESNQNTIDKDVEIPVYGVDSDATQEDCFKIGGTLHFNYDNIQYECILE